MYGVSCPKTQGLSVFARPSDFCNASQRKLSGFSTKHVERRWLTLKHLKGMLEVQLLKCCTDEPLRWFPVIDSSIHIPPFGTLTFNPYTGMPKIFLHVCRGETNIQAIIKTQVQTLRNLIMYLMYNVYFTFSSTFC